MPFLEERGITMIMSIFSFIIIFRMDTWSILEQEDK